MISNLIEKRIEQQSNLDRIADPVHDAVRSTLERVPRIHRALRGHFLGHPLHAAITDVPVGAWTAGTALDLIDLLRGTKKLRRGADAVHAIGLVGALAAAVAGLADYAHTNEEARRVGFVHGVANVVIAGLFGGSLYARAKGKRGTGIALAGAGYALMLASTWIGGELAYRLGVGIRDEAFEKAGRADDGEDTGEGEGEDIDVEMAELDIVYVP